MEGGTEDQRAYLDIGNQPASCWPSRVIISGDVMYTGEGARESSEMSRARSVDRGQILRVF